MNRIFASKLLLLACLFGRPVVTAQVQNKQQAKPQVVFTTAPKLVAATLKLTDGTSSVVRGRASLTIIKANENDSLNATLTYQLPDSTRQIIAKMWEHPLADVPSNVIEKDLTATFQRGTSCPLVNLQVSAKDVEVGNATLQLNKVVLDIHETPDHINQLFCSWTRQINVKRQRLGIIAAINRLIIVAEDVENQTVKP